MVVEFLGLADILRLVSTLWGLTGRLAVAGLVNGWGVAASFLSSPRHGVLSPQAAYRIFWSSPGLS